MRKKIFFISTEFPPYPGGIGSHAYNVINELKKLDWDFCVCTNQHYAKDEEIIEFNIKYHSQIIRLWETPSLRKLLYKIIFIVRKVNDYKPDLIISSGKHASIFGFFAKLLTGTPIVTIGHGTEFGMISNNLKWPGGLFYNYSDLMISVSNYTQNYLKEIKRIKSKKYVVIYNGADHLYFKPLLKKNIEHFKNQNNISDYKILLSVGQISDRKGQFVIIRSLPYILQKFPNVHYYCIGHPNQVKKFAEIASENKVEGNVHFLGIKNKIEMLNWYNACDIFTMTSTHTDEGDFEGFGISVIEAALCKKPSIVTKDTSGVIESIVDGVTGIGVKEKDYKETAEAVLRLLSDDNLRNKMGENAYIRAIEEFTWKIQAKKYNDELLKLIK